MQQVCGGRGARKKEERKKNDDVSQFLWKLWRECCQIKIDVTIKGEPRSQPAVFFSFIFPSEGKGVPRFAMCVHSPPSKVGGGYRESCSESARFSAFVCLETHLVLPQVAVVEKRLEGARG